MYQAGFSLQKVAEYYNVTRQAMWDILRVRNIPRRNQLKFKAENHFYRGTHADGRVHDIVETAIGNGTLIPSPCEKCGANGTFQDGRREVQAHHDDYNFPMSVRWLCQKHHHEWHKNNKAKAVAKK